MLKFGKYIIGTRHVFKQHVASFGSYDGRRRSSLTSKKRIFSENEVEKTNKQQIDSDFGLKKFIRKTYMYTGGGILSTLGMGVTFLTIPELHTLVPHFFVGGIVLSIGGCIGVEFTNYTIKNKVLIDSNDEVKGNYYYTENSFARQLSFGSVVVGIGLVAAPAIAIAGATDVLLPAVLSTSAVFGGATWYAGTKKSGELEVWGPALYGGLTGLVGCGLTGLGSALIFGPNVFD